MARKPGIADALTELMKRSKRHAWTLEDLQAALARRGTPTDFSSIFRAAEKLAAAGAIHKLLLEDGRARFELIGSHHDHLHCARCDTLIPVPCVIPAKAFAALEARTGSAIIAHRVIFNGVCRNCRTPASARKAESHIPR
jgi:Fe2+ or Zn2+ uptake regulation protein